MNYLFSIIIPTFNGEKSIGGLLEKITHFSSNYSKETIIIDSGSNDGTLDIINSYRSKIAYLKLIEINKKEFNHGLTRNLGVKIAKGKYICFFSQDAKPISKRFLDYYLEDFKIDKKIKAIYGKHIYYLNTPIIQKIESDCFWSKLDPYLNKKGVLIKNISHEFVPFNKRNKYLWYEVSDTSSCYQRDFLLKNPFPRTMYGEDMMAGKAIIDSGLSIVYDTRCSVKHSHSYSLFEYYKREKESVGLVINGMKLRKKTNFICKLEKVMNLKMPYYKKIYYFGELVVYYFLKLLILAILKIEAGMNRRT
ncbi:hypothetical protein A2768_01785 [Candidatus Roizmanbacteria bacterium RIFCSPHIGHO2_01_FULL_37_16]|nr:MAG: hypothetical protein A2768_01785 [Candidatus Roizmanbacteria bacterium RIFCSPHIGHO2_01_FULL_37_16]